MRTSETRLLAIAGLAASLSLSLGCGSDTTGPSSGIKDGYWQLQLDHRAITLSLTAPSNQLRLQATPLDTRGDPIVTASKVQYTSKDSSVIVDSTGLLTAKSVGFGIWVIAHLTIPNDEGQAITLTDSAIVNVNAPSPVPVFSKLQFVTPGDSATFAASGSFVLGLTGLTVNALDATNAPLIDDNAVNVSCLSSNNRIVDFRRGIVGPSISVSNLAYVPGTVTITCEATIYGVSLTDSISVHVGMPLYTKITIDTQLVTTGIQPVVLSRNVVKIGIGGIIQWDNRSARQVDLVFDDPTAPQSVPVSERTFGSGILGGGGCSVNNCLLPSGTGNVMLPPATNRNFNNGIGRDYRRFTRVGTYPYHSATFPTVMGTIVVQ